MGLTTRVKLTTKAILAQAAAWATTPVGIITIAAGAVLGLVAAVKSSSKAFEEQQQIVAGLKSDIESLTSEYTNLFDKTNRTDEENQKLKIIEAQLEAKKALLAIEAKEAYKKYAYSTGRNKVGEAEGYKNQIEKDNDLLNNLDRGNYSNDAKGAAKFLKESEAIQKRIENNRKNLAQAITDMSAEYDLLQDILDTNGKFDDDVQKDRYDELSDAIDGAKEALGGFGDELDGIEDKSPEIDSISTALDKLIDKLDAAQGSINALAGAMKDFNEDGELTYSSISNIAQKFSEVQGIDDYVNRLAEANLTASEFQTVMDELAVAIVQQQIASGALTEATANLTIKMLEESGLANAAEVVHWALADSQRIAAGTAIDNARALNSEGESAYYAKGGLDNAKTSAGNLSGTSINTSGIVKPINDISTAAYNAANTVNVLRQTLAGNPAVLGDKYNDRGNKSSSKPSNIPTPPSLPPLPIWKPSGFGGGSRGGGNGGGGGGGSAKEVEEYKAKIDKLYEATKRLEDIKYEIERLEVKSEITDDQEAQIKNLNEIVLLYKEEQKVLAELAELRRADIRGNIKELEAVGFEVAYNADTNDLLVKNLENVNNLVGETTEKTNELRKKYEDLISVTEKLNDANRDASKEWWNLKQKIKDARKEYDNIISSTVDVYKATVRAIQKVIDKEKEALELQKEGFERQKSNLETTVNTVVSFIDKQIEALQKENDEIDRQIEAQKKLEEIERAKNQRVHRIFREGIGYDFDIDYKAANKAQRDYDEFKRKRELEDKVRALEDYKKLWQDVTDSYQRGVDEQITADILGANWQRDVLAQKTSNIQQYANDYAYVNKQLDENVAGSVAYQIKQLNDLSKQWSDSYDEIEETISEHKANLDILKNFEDGNYKDRLIILKEFISNSIAEIERLKRAQAELGEEGSEYGKGVLPGHDFSTDTTDYSEKMLNSKDEAEFQHWSQMRNAKMDAQGINPSSEGWRTNSDLYSEWKNSVGSSGGNYGGGGTTGGGTYQAKDDGHAPSGLSVGDKVNTAGGTYQIVSPNTPGANYNPASGYWSVKAYSQGGVADFTGLAMLHGGNAAELILNNADAGKIYEYIHNTPSIVEDMVRKVAASKLIPMASNIAPNQMKNLSLSMGNIIIENADNPNKFAKDLIAQFPNIMKQEFYKN